MGLYLLWFPAMAGLLLPKINRLLPSWLFAQAGPAYQSQYQHVKVTQVAVWEKYVHVHVGFRLHSEKNVWKCERNNHSADGEDEEAGGGAQSAEDDPLWSRRFFLSVPRGDPAASAWMTPLLRQTQADWAHGSVTATCTHKEASYCIQLRHIPRTQGTEGNISARESIPLAFSGASVCDTEAPALRMCMWEAPSHQEQNMTRFGLEFRQETGVGYQSLLHVLITASPSV